MAGDGFYWMWWSDKQWALASSVSTTVGVLVAIVAGLFAFLSYRASTRSADNAHMHGLFRDYLRTKFDHLTLIAAAGEGKNKESRDAARFGQLGQEVASIKLYVLEEMWSWIDVQARDPLRFLHSREARRLRNEALDAWRATIISHVDEDRAEVVNNIYWNTPCYSVGFLEFLSSAWSDDADFSRMVASQKTAGPRGVFLREFDLAG